MAKDGRIYDGVDTGIAVDSDGHPSYLPPNIDSSAVNICYRGGVRKTRPPFSELNITSVDGDESVVEAFKAGNFQGACAYKAIKTDSYDGIVVSVAGSIYFISIINNKAMIRLLMEGNDATVMHTWFCQAEDWMYIQNGHQNPIAWDGDMSGKPTNLRTQGLGSPTTSQTPFSTTLRQRTSGTVKLTLTSPLDVVAGDYIKVDGCPAAYNGVHLVTGNPTPNTVEYQNTGPDEGSIADVSGSVYKYIGTVGLTWTSNLKSQTGVEVQARQGTELWVSVETVKTNLYHYLTNDVLQDHEFRVRSVLPDGSTTPWSNTALGNPENTSKSTEYADSISRINPAKQQMPIGTIMAYAHGRVWVSDKQNNIFASDIIFGSGFTVTSNTKNFTDQTYWNEGGSFTPPATLGNITGMKVMPFIGANTRGQGELVVMCENGAFTIDGSVDRTLWKDSNIQRVALMGRGCTSPWSMCSVNNEMFFRSDDGWSLFQNSQQEFNMKLSFRNLSKEVRRWVDKDTPWMKQFASAIFFDNRVICTVSPYTLSSTIKGQGMHRPHRGMVVLDLDQSTATSPDAALTFRWNGLWTGPKPVQVILAQLRGQSRAFVFSFGDDKKNRLFELLTGGGTDYVNGTTVPIKSYFITKRMDFAASKQTNKYYNKGLNGGDMWVSGITQNVKMSASYRPDSYPEWSPLLGEISVGVDSNEQSGDSLVFSQPRYKQIRFNSPDDICKMGGDGITSTGAEFQVLMEMVGCVTIDRLRISADTLKNVDDPTGDCPTDPVNKDPIASCPIDDFNYHNLT